jgi:hypothetical protein
VSDTPERPTKVGYYVRTVGGGERFIDAPAKVEIDAGSAQFDMANGSGVLYNLAHVISIEKVIVVLPLPKPKTPDEMVQ